MPVPQHLGPRDRPAAPRHGTRRAGVVALILVWAWTVASAAPAAADAPVPTDYRSTVTDITPGSDVLDVTVIGGDAMLELRVDAGHEVVVNGYNSEPYIRIAEDGTVLENLNSSATYANTDRYGDVDLPRDLDPNAAPDWEQVADGGSFAWHDHRIHWMSPQPPPGIPRGEDIQGWTVDLLVDGEPVAVQGVLSYEEAIAWWPWMLAVAGIAAAVALVGLRRRGRAAVVASIAAAAGGVLAVIVAASEQLAIPLAGDRSFVQVLVPVVGIVCAVAAVFLRGRVANAVGLAAASAVGGWAALRFEVFTKPILPTDLSPGLDRVGTAAALGLALAAAVLLVTTARPADTRSTRSKLRSESST